MVKNFGILPSGSETHLYTIYSDTCRAVFSDLGASWVSFLMPDRSGAVADVVLGFDSAGEYFRADGCLGAVVGRYANRIGGAAFSLGGETVHLCTNEGENNLHSGPDYWHLRLWEVVRHEKDTVTFCLDSTDGDQGFPGGGRVTVTYALSGSRLTVTCGGCFDRDTVFNPTQHAYFNLAGHDRPESAMRQKLTVHASRFTPVDNTSIPTGELRSVAGTVLDFTHPKTLGLGLEREPLLSPQRGLDHNFVLDNPGLDTPAAKLFHEDSGRSLTVYTDCPGLQVYAANYLHARGKGGTAYTPNSGVCLETQFFPNSVNVPQWPQCAVKAGQIVTRTTVFDFGVEG